MRRAAPPTAIPAMAPVPSADDELDVVVEFDSDPGVMVTILAAGRGSGKTAW